MKEIVISANDRDHADLILDQFCADIESGKRTCPETDDVLRIQHPEGRDLFVLSGFETTDEGVRCVEV